MISKQFSRKKPKCKLFVNISTWLVIALRESEPNFKLQKAFQYENFNFRSLSGLKTNFITEHFIGSTSLI